MDVRYVKILDRKNAVQNNLNFSLHLFDNLSFNLEILKSRTSLEPKNIPGLELLLRTVGSGQAIQIFLNYISWAHILGLSFIFLPDSTLNAFNGAMPSLTNQLEFRLSPTQPGGYYLDGKLLRSGDPIEIWTILGWESGRFSWDGGGQLPYLDQGRPSHTTMSGVEQNQLVILAHTICRHAKPQFNLHPNLHPNPSSNSSSNSSSDPDADESEYRDRWRK